MPIYDRDDRDLQSVSFRGFTCEDVFNFHLREYERITTFDGKFFSITDIDNKKRSSFETGYSGFLGIEPYTLNEGRKEANFLWKLRD